MIKRALISVSDKEGIVEFAEKLSKKGIEIVSTGGTAKIISDAGIPVTNVEDVTKFPECFSGRVKTMHPLIMGGVLFRRGDKEHEKQAEELGIGTVDLVVVNLYPFEEGCEQDKNEKDIVELIDIGGPTLLRSAAKNFDSVTVVCDSRDYARVIEQIEKDGDTSLDLRKELATKVFLRTAAYDSAITEWMSNGENKGLMMTNKRELRYGENPHQEGSFYEIYRSNPGWEVLQEEKQMSYLNILDADGAWNLVNEFEDPTAACIKHANPSGVASHEDIAEAFQRSYDTDRLSAFGVIISLNRECTKEVVEKIIEQKIFAEILIAPGYSEEAIELLKKKPKLRVIANREPRTANRTYRSCLDGMLVQNEDDNIVSESDLTCVTDKKPTDDQIRDLLFAWKVVKHAKSNAIVFTKDQISVGIGCGQTSRVDSAIIAARRAGDRSQNAVMASDAFFPFPDCVEEAAKHGISAIIQPGGSIRDEEVFAKANELGIVMVTTGVRAFRH
ncbi:bifunctional phosphoribosylaminoimidazolecarboxamide formyltransferase/IMP cyclohydrolase [Candidatus Peribacteria bacterium]|nr:bifunctional phosphoribosylaminoimidazolecarboxamide formyltransferase/IMP cyclohydrolase [Candidatus Peribacteria bacterium]MBT4021405.1 bifunctional phosphoribosylaminoimidazolecarboxamide formyltransferase/IMP cyclohydrolase [Candidatus Peribacteria bacterium]MBT4240421.1 bifunctional phosphoribosylaminoimidazolecarboxamide formyltransferase/IMP cyclohydrolase [Candidatus Peribacteria bacterium]MBT4474503.1 bifunctional phosphoribosylaminoimidazolecarboxamide formyltransferase/IMP cyclohyd